LPKNKRIFATGLLLFLLGISAGSTPQLSVLARDILAAHNSVRKPLRIAPLSWSNELALKAQDWANNLIKTGKFYHRQHTAYGENLLEFTGTSANAKPEEVVQEWKAEVIDYDYSSNRCRSVCGHYTQIVWRSTREVGCAVARSARREVWVCEYDPPGNVAGQKPY
jgi:uncharacterized protein YkwD